MIWYSHICWFELVSQVSNVTHRPLVCIYIILCMYWNCWVSNWIIKSWFLNKILNKVYFAVTSYMYSNEFKREMQSGILLICKFAASLVAMPGYASIAFKRYFWKQIYMLMKTMSSCFGNVQRMYEVIRRLNELTRERRCQCLF